MKKNQLIKDGNWHMLKITLDREALYLWLAKNWPTKEGKRLWYRVWAATYGIVIK